MIPTVLSAHNSVGQKFEKGVSTAVVCNCSRMLAGAAGTRDGTSKMLTLVAGSNDDSWLGEQLGCQPSTYLLQGLPSMVVSYMAQLPPE